MYVQILSFMGTGADAKSRPVLTPDITMEMGLGPRPQRDSTRVYHFPHILDCCHNSRAMAPPFWVHFLGFMVHTKPQDFVKT